MKRTSEQYLKDILQFIIRVRSYTLGFKFENFTKNQLIVDATIRNLEIIGEAASQLSEEVKVKHPEVPWNNIKNFRNVIIHKYQTVDLEIVWDIIQHRLNPLEKQINAILTEIKRSKNDKYCN